MVRVGLITEDLVEAGARRLVEAQGGSAKEELWDITIILGFLVHWALEV